MSFHSVLDKFHSVLDRLANGELGWMVVLMLWVTELAIVLSLFLIVRHARGLEVDLQEARRSIVSLKNSLARISRELRSQQDEFRAWRQPPPDVPRAADSASPEKSHASASELDAHNEEDFPSAENSDASPAMSPAHGDEF
jgi:hypothetical protein